MTDLVPTADIERLVGARRHPIHHLARLDSASSTVYILHSLTCLDSGIDLRECRWSLSLDAGIREEEWLPDETLLVAPMRSGLLPFGHTTPKLGAARRTAKPAHERAAYLARLGVELLDGGESDG